MKVALRSDTLVLSNAEAGCGVLTDFRPLGQDDDGETSPVSFLLMVVWLPSVLKQKNQADKLGS